MRLSRAQRSVVYVMIAAFAVAIGIGLWPVHANVFGDPSYSCGSGFFHSAHKWKVDSQVLSNERTGDDLATGTPKQVCPNKVLNSRDWAIVVGSIALVVGLLVIFLTSGTKDRTATAISASMRLRKR